MLQTLDDCLKRGLREQLQIWLGISDLQLLQESIVKIFSDQLLFTREIIQQ